MTNAEMTAAAKSARLALWHAAARLQMLRPGAHPAEQRSIDVETDAVQIDLRVLDAVLVLLNAVETPPVTLDAPAEVELRTLARRLDRQIQRDALRQADLTELRATIARARVIARTLGPLFA